MAAARSFADARHSQIEEARRELTELLLDARLGEEGPPALYRARSRATQLDISARVVQEGRLLVVLAVSAREYR